MTRRDDSTAALERFLLGLALYLVSIPIAGEVLEVSGFRLHLAALLAFIGQTLMAVAILVSVASHFRTASA